VDERAQERSLKADDRVLFQVSVCGSPQVWIGGSDKRSNAHPVFPMSCRLIKLNQPSGGSSDIFLP